jgi:hypothetical protein
MRPAFRLATTRFERSRRSWWLSADSEIPRSAAKSHTHSSCVRDRAWRILARVGSAIREKVEATASADS